MNDASDLCAASDVIFSAVVASASEDVGLRVAAEPLEGKVLVDINAASPEAKIRVANAVAQSGGGFVDVSLMGAVSLYGHRVPLEVSGTAAEAFASTFGALGFKIHVISDKAGDAASIKMLRSIALKGMGAAVIEALVAAERLGVAEQAFHAICDPMDATSFSEWTVMCLLTDGLHAGRRAAEMEAAITFLNDMKEPPIVSAAVLERLRVSEALGFKALYGDGGGPTDWREALSQYVN
jgi:3-hydroxyisobutyrate dehydrogenase-like beta-hydroxyacid dehydrogenase